MTIGDHEITVKDNMSTLKYLWCHVSVRATEGSTSRSLILDASDIPRKTKIGNDGLVIFRE